MQEGDLVISEFMANPANDGSCSDSDGEYIEVYYSPGPNPSMSSLDLWGLSIGDGTVSHRVTDTVVLYPGEYAWFSRGSQSCYGNPHSYLSMSLNNSGDTIVVDYTDADGSYILFDQLTYGADQGEAGTAVELSNNSLDATSNDDLANWCGATQQIPNTTDYGTPGTAGNCMQ